VVATAAAAFLVAAFVSSQLKTAEILPDFREGYHPGALSLREGTGYLLRSGEFNSTWPPGTSVFISPWVVEDVVDSARRLRFVAGLVAAAWVVMIAWLSRRVVPRVPIQVVLGLAVFWPPMWALGDPTGSEMLFSALLALAVSLLVFLYRLSPSLPLRTVVLTASAWAALAAAALTRTMGIAVAGAILIAILFGFHRWSAKRRLVVALLGTSVFVGGLTPWVLFFKNQTGQFGFTTSGIESTRYGLRRTSHIPLASELAERSTRWRSYEDVWSDATELGTADPVGAARLLATKIVRPWYFTSSGRLDHVIIIIQLPWLVFFAIACARTLRRWRRVPGEVIMLHGCVAALWLTAVTVSPLLRYLLPSFPFVVIVVFWHAVDAGLLKREVDS
jgi:4-amino-4-deoxy-L-arabinose transferase-like glycosyltransferase